MSKIKPIGKTVIVEPMPVTENKSVGGILLNSADSSSQSRGIVIATGTKCVEEIPLESVVIYGSDMELVYEHEGKKLFMMPESNVIAIVE